MSLKEAISKLPPVTDGRSQKTWVTTLSKSNPKAYRELLEVADDWNAHGKTRVVFPNMRALWRYLSGRDEDRPLKHPLVSINESSFRIFMNDRKGNRG